MEPIIVATFYKFVDLPEYQAWQRPLREYCKSQGVRGSILLAEEGINATIAGTRQGIDAVLAHLRADERLADMTHKESSAETMPFVRMKVRLKKEIVNLGLPEINPNNGVGTYVPAQQWNDLITDPDVILVDTRNDFEFQVGTFQGAINPKTDAFNEFPAFVQQHLDPARHKKVAMFCTGGIRCEKATAYLLQQGFSEVYHLKDGILKYLEEVPGEQSLWQGDCFVFDERVAIGHNLEVMECELCPACSTKVCGEARQSPHYKRGVYCPNCYDSMTPERIARFEEKQRQKQLQQQRVAQQEMCG